MMDDRQWQAALNVLRSSRSPKHRVELEAMLRKDRQKRQQELGQARDQVETLRAALKLVEPPTIEPWEDDDDEIYIDNCHHLPVKTLRVIQAALAATPDAQEDSHADERAD